MSATYYQVLHFRHVWTLFAIVAALYLLIAVAVVLIVTHNLTSNIDGTLSTWLSSMAADRQTVTRGLPGPPGPHGGPRLGDAPVLWWM